MIKAKILLVDDRPENLFSLEAAIEQEDREIFKAESGNEALKLIRLHEFALILSDVQMPEMNGFEMVEIIRLNKNQKHIPVIFVTAINKDEKYVYKGYEEGAVDYLFKPLDPKIVNAKVDIFIQLWQQKHQLKLQKEELEKLNREKNKFIGMMAHDIRNPLSVIDFFSNELLEKYQNDQASEEFINSEYIKTSSKFIKNLVDEVLEISKIESGTIELSKEDVNPNFFLSEMAKLNRIMSERKEITISENFEKYDQNILFDQQKLTQVINNLITNAVKFSNENTAIEIGSKFENENFIFWIEDQGQGIPEDEIDKLFIPFSKISVQSTKGEPSTGLGLTIVKRIIEAHNGKIQVKSEVGVGTKFIIEIPIIPAPNIEFSQEDLSGPNSNNPIGHGYKTLIIDDDLIITKIQERALKRLGFNVKIANSGQDALQLIEQFKPDMIFTDINIPDMSGYEISAAIRANDTATPIIGLTGFVTEEIIDKCKAEGMNEVVDKSNLGRLRIESIADKYLS